MGRSWWPLFVMCICFKVTQSKGSSWTVQVPSSVKGLTGSCVVIPCSYNYPDPHKSVSGFTGIWRNENDQAIYHPNQSHILNGYRDRTKLLGDLRGKNCSLMIDKLQQNTKNTFYFRIELEGYDKFSYKENRVSMAIISEPEPIHFSVQEVVNEGQSVSASCSVSHSCPEHPPTFQWSQPGERHFHAQQLSSGQWNTTSTLTFQPNHKDHNKTLRCSVTYHGGKQQETSKILLVKYAPVNVKVEYKSNANEGETVHLKCSSDAHPPVSSYEWHNETGALLYQGNTYTMSDVSRYSGRALYCTAINEQGQGKSSSVQLNVLYAPDIKTSSKCSSEGDVLKCECIIESNPASTVRFVVADRTLQSSKEEKNGTVTTATLQTSFGSFKFVHCLANNSLGNANLTLSLPFNQNTQNILIALGSGGIFLIIFIVAGIGVVKKWRSGDTPTSNLSTTKADGPVELPRYATTERKENYEDTHCSDIYANDHVYGNIGTDWEESIYANM